jgi:hypothetical protein
VRRSFDRADENKRKVRRTSGEAAMTALHTGFIFDATYDRCLVLTKGSS